MRYVRSFVKVPRWMTRRRVVIAMVCLAALAGVSTWAVGSWLYRTELALARREINEGRAERGGVAPGLDDAALGRRWRDRLSAGHLRRQPGAGR